MKLATLRDGTRDGRLVVVSRDLTRYTDASFMVRTLQAALDDWPRYGPQLEAMAGSLETGAVPSSRFHEHDATSPLPRAYARIVFPDALDGHELAPSAHFGAPRDAILVERDSSLDARIEMAAIFGDLPAAATRDEVSAELRLVMLGNRVRQANGRPGSEEIVTCYSPVAVTPDELGPGWDAVATDLTLHLSVNGRPFEHAGTRFFSGFADRVARLARIRPLYAGTIVVSPVIDAGPSVKIGDSLRIEMREAAGHSVFGAIEQPVQRPG